MPRRNCGWNKEPCVVISLHAKSNSFLQGQCAFTLPFIPICWGYSSHWHHLIMKIRLRLCNPVTPHLSSAVCAPFLFSQGSAHFLFLSLHFSPAFWIIQAFYSCGFCFSYSAHSWNSLSQSSSSLALFFFFFFQMNCHLLKHFPWWFSSR